MISRIGVLCVAAVKRSLELINTYHNSNLDGDLYKVGAQMAMTGRASEGTLRQRLWLLVYTGRFKVISLGDLNILI